jgi:hypothetical protein
VHVLTAQLPVLFARWPKVLRFEGQTREDNVLRRRDWESGVTTPVIWDDLIA